MDHGEPMQRIMHVTDARLIRVFFGDRAVPYDHTHMRDENGEYSRELHEHYYGILVPVALADLWYSGIKDCEDAGVDPDSRKGLTYRYYVMMQDFEPGIPMELGEYIDAREAAAATAEASQEKAVRSLVATRAQLDLLIAGLKQSSVGPDVAEVVSPDTDAAAMQQPDGTLYVGDCRFGGEGMVKLACGHSIYLEGRTVDGQRVVRVINRRRDNYSVYYYAPDALVKTWALAAARKREITAEQAEKWLERYKGCEGTDVYQAALEQAS